MPAPSLKTSASKTHSNYDPQRLYEFEDGTYLLFSHITNVVPYNSNKPNYFVEIAHSGDKSWTSLPLVQRGNNPFSSRGTTRTWFDKSKGYDMFIIPAGCKCCDNGETVPYLLKNDGTKTYFKQQILKQVLASDEIQPHKKLLP